MSLVSKVYIFNIKLLAPQELKEYQFVSVGLITNACSSIKFCNVYNRLSSSQELRSACNAFYLLVYLFSMFDILSDFLLFTTFLAENNPMFARLTLLFIYLPSLNVLAILLGPRTAGILGQVWGMVIMIVGQILGTVLETETVSWSSLMLGFVMLYLGGIMFGSCKWKDSPKLVPSFLSRVFLPGLIFPLLLPLSPLIFICVKVAALAKPRNSMLKAQSAVGSRGSQYWRRRHSLLCNATSFY